MFPTITCSLVRWYLYIIADQGIYEKDKFKKAGNISDNRINSYCIKTSLLNFEVVKLTLAGISRLVHDPQLLIAHSFSLFTKYTLSISFSDTVVQQS